MLKRYWSFVKAWLRTCSCQQQSRFTVPRLLCLEERITPSNTYTVSSPNDSGYGTLRYYAGIAGTGDTINFSTIFKTQSIKLASQINLSVSLTIDGTGVLPTISGNGATRIFAVTGSVTDTLKNLTLSNGLVGGANVNGGAITVAAASTLNLTYDTFSNNKTTAASGAGGAIYNLGTLNDTGSTFKNNQSAVGGAIDNQGTLTLNGTLFQSNTASNSGGAIESGSTAAGTPLTVSNADFVSNSATNVGGAIDTSNSTSLTGDTFGGSQASQGNAAVNGGGAVNAAGGTNGSTKLTVTGSTFSYNQVTGTLRNGGAINSSLITDIETSTFTCNSASAGGAVYYSIVNTGPAYDSTLTINQDTFENNSNTGTIGGGAGVYAIARVNSGLITMSVTNTTLAGNQGIDGGGALFDEEASGTGTIDGVLINDTFLSNVSSDHGGGLYVYLDNTGTGATKATLKSLTVYQNSAGVVLPCAPLLSITVVYHRESLPPR
jgi:predicted outer membrane repeat protein